MLTKDGIQYHIGCKADDLGRYCILPGDPGRCEKIAAYLDDSVHIGFNREYNVYTGTLLGEKVTVMSTGMGGPSAAIGMEELCESGCDTFIRVGTCGGIDKTVKAGDCVIATGAVRNEGTSREYAPIEFPAVSDYNVLNALVNGAEKLGITYHTGVVHCKDSFYGQHNPDSMPVSYELKNKWDAWKRLHVLASEMESAALFTVASARCVKCGTVLLAVWNQERDDNQETHDTDKAIRIAIKAIKILIENNRKKNE